MAPVSSLLCVCCTQELTIVIVKNLKAHHTYRHILVFVTETSLTVKEAVPLRKTGMLGKNEQQVVYLDGKKYILCERPDVMENIEEARLRCHHDVPDRFSRQRKKISDRNWSCPTRMTVAIRQSAAKVTSKKPYAGYAMRVTCNGEVHNHARDSVATLKFRRVGEAAKERMLRLFAQQLSPPEALRTLKQQLREEHGSDYDRVAADRSVVPDLGYAYSLYYANFGKRRKMKIKTNGMKTVETNAIETKTEPNDLEEMEVSGMVVGREGDETIVAAISPVERVQSLNGASDVVFVDSSGHFLDEWLIPADASEPGVMDGGLDAVVYCAPDADMRGGPTISVDGGPDISVDGDPDISVDASSGIPVDSSPDTGEASVPAAAIDCGMDTVLDSGVAVVVGGGPDAAVHAPGGDAAWSTDAAGATTDVADDPRPQSRVATAAVERIQQWAALVSRQILEEDDGRWRIASDTFIRQWERLTIAGRLSALRGFGRPSRQNRSLSQFAVRSANATISSFVRARVKVPAVGPREVTRTQELYTRQPPLA
ncbi:uncharacterized protein LOC119104004 isoform X2 [Pollicipes pollicipes]|uniref:uncharacterized protein LOC119104004 isoform X2 n=1 Tax=Pollicipes pollicipes TaxID=41117 RepID=UPI0018850CF5|nr:uncharacterized protein LOC119104004 isoform X2 [Pollicipes pollicipes]